MFDSIKIRKSAIVKELLALTFPSYRGRTFKLQPASKVTLHDLHWAGGTRNVYHAVDMSNGQARKLDMTAIAPWDKTNPEGKPLELPPNIVVVCHSHFMGHDMGITFYVHPSHALIGNLQAKALTA